MDGLRNMANDDVRADGVQRNQCWWVRIKQARRTVLVKVMDVDETSVVLRALNNVDLIARYARADIEFLRQVEF